MNQRLVGKTYQQAEAFSLSAPGARAYGASTLGSDTTPIAAYADGALAPPMYGVAFSFGALGAPILDPELGVEMMRLVHGEQDMEFLQAARAGDVLTSTSTIAAIHQKASGEVLVIEITSKNQHGEVVLRVKSGLFIRGPRKKGSADPQADAKKANEAAQWQELPRVLAEVVVVAADQSRRYAEASGDHNPIHLDEGVAQMAGLPSIILHGLCTMAFVHDALVRKFGPDPLCVQRLAVRFLKPVLMGDRLTIDVRGRGKSLWLQVKNQLDVVVLTGAQVQIA